MAQIRTGNTKERLPGRWFGLAALSVSALVLGLDITILITALPTLSARLDATTDQLQWMSAAYTLSLAGFMLPAGVLGDRFGRRRMLLIGLVTFGLSSVIASQMTSANGLILMRVVMGASGAIVLPLVTSILPSMFDEDERQRAIGISGAGAFIGLPLGPLVAGWLLTHYAWGSIFLINAPVVVIATIGVWFFIPESKDPSPRSLDWVGALLEMIGVTGLVYGIIEEPVHGWGSIQVAGPLVGGALLIAAFIAWQLRTRTPLVDLNLFRNRRFALSTVAFTIVGFAMTGVLFVLSPYLQVVQHNDAQGTGIRLLPLIAAMMAGAVSSDWLSKRLGAKVMVSGGMLGIAASMLLLSRAGADSGYTLVAIALALMGLAIAFTMIPALDAILAALPAGQTGAGSALTRAIQNVGASFGVAIMGSILNSAYQAHLSGQLTDLPAALRSAAETSVAVAGAAAAHLPPQLGDRLLSAAGGAYAQGMSDVLLVTAGLMVVGAILMALFLPARAPHHEQLPLAKAEVSLA
ncbi:MAG TPA: DHA2 family efflux MFS transporter permease subunit [Candidatus Acidoferrum sp.]|jgi:DHA2 family multidrug resistance protein-like MFS transporter|nr:DHA2 family efflux MFS transporter permease subunit [Candidatus Acidoferrum sp.]